MIANEPMLFGLQVDDWKNFASFCSTPALALAVAYLVGVDLLKISAPSISSQWGWLFERPDTKCLCVPSQEQPALPIKVAVRFPTQNQIGHR
jgi:hypothetical protein